MCETHMKTVGGVDRINTLMRSRSNAGKHDVVSLECSLYLHAECWRASRRRVNNHSRRTALTTDLNIPPTSLSSKCRVPGCESSLLCGTEYVIRGLNHRVVFGPSYGFLFHRKENFFTFIKCKDAALSTVYILSLRFVICSVLHVFASWIVEKLVRPFVLSTSASAFFLFL